MKKTLLLIATLFLLHSSSCSTQKQESSNEIPVIDLKKDYPVKDHLVSEYADIEYIFMETSNDVLLDDISDLYLSVTERYITTCNTKEGRIFVFDRQGKHLHNFMRKGNSGEEYVYIKNVRLDDKAEEIFVLSSHKKVLVYTLDGKFKRALNLPDTVAADDLWNYNDEWLLSYDSYNLDRNKPCTEQPFFCISKNDGRIIRLGINATDRVGKRIYFEQNGQKGVMQISYNNIYKNGNEFILSELGSDTIYILKQDEIKPLLIRTPGSKANETRSLMCAPLKLGDYITLSEVAKKFVLENGKIETNDITYNLKTGEACTLILKDDINFTEPMEIRHANQMVEAPENHILWMPDTDKLFKWKEEGKLKGKLAELVETMTEDDNPILIIYKFH